MSTPPQTTDALLIDALGTLLWLDSPAEHLREELGARGVVVTPDQAVRAFRAEVRYYLANHLQGRDAVSLAALRRRCAAVAAAEAGVDAALMLDALLAALRFRPFDDAAPALSALRDAHPRLTVVAVSNWDCSLQDVLESTGLARHLDAVVTSADAGAAKPHPAIFELALRAAGTGPRNALHVGDSPENDVAGARAAGVRCVLIDRSGRAPQPAGVPVIRSLRDLPSVI